MVRHSRFVILLVLYSIFFILQVLVGCFAHSLALVADSFHVIGDVMSLVVALYAMKLSKKSNISPNFSYGFGRAEIVGGLINGVSLLALCLGLFIASIQRFFEPQEISQPQLLLIVGTAGLIANIVGLVMFHDHSHGHHHDIESSHVEPETFARNGNQKVWNNSESDVLLNSIPSKTTASFLEDDELSDIDNDESHLPAPRTSDSHCGSTHHKTDLNIQGVFLHILADAVGHLGVIISALLIWLTDFSWRFYSDPFISLVTTAIIFANALPLVKRASIILLQGVPAGIDVNDVTQSLLEIDGVDQVQQLHIWQLSQFELVASVHVRVSYEGGIKSYLAIAEDMRACFSRYGIRDCTIQPEFPDGATVQVENTQSGFESDSSRSIDGNL